MMLQAASIVFGWMSNLIEQPRASQHGCPAGASHQASPPSGNVVHVVPGGHVVQQPVHGTGGCSFPQQHRRWVTSSTSGTRRNRR